MQTGQVVIFTLADYANHWNPSPSCLFFRSSTSSSRSTHSSQMTVSKEQLIDALYNEYVFLCHDDFDPDEDATPEEYLEMLKEMTYNELVEETGTDEIFSMNEFMEAWS